MILPLSTIIIVAIFLFCNESREDDLEKDLESARNEINDLRDEIRDSHKNVYDNYENSEVRYLDY